MSAATQITEQQRRQLLTGHFALSHREMVRYWLLSEKDINGINGRRREHNHLGYAVQLCLLRYPGWPLKADEPVPPNLLNYVGQQLGADTAQFTDYAKRDNTRQEHQVFLRWASFSNRLSQTRYRTGKRQIRSGSGGDLLHSRLRPVRALPRSGDQLHSADATYVLDGLLNHQTDLRIEEHYTDTSGYTDHIFALCHLLGFRFAPRIRDLSDHRMFSFEKPALYDSIKSLMSGRVHERTIRRDWDDVARLVTSLRQGTASPSLLVGKLAGHPRQNHLFVALREIGRVERSLFTLEWLQDPELRRRVTIGLNKGEAHHTLKRAIRFYRRGSVNDRTQLVQDLNAMALNLVVAAIILWNTAYLDRAIQVLNQEGISVPDEYLAHISPLGWEHITITGTYHWKGVDRPWGRFQPLRRDAVELLRSKIV